MKRILVLVNPAAGGGVDTDELVRRVTADPLVAVVETEGPDEARRRARQAADEGYETVVAAGGDGTIHEVAAGIDEGGGRAVLAVIPLGTGNDLIRSLGVPEDLDRAVRVVRAGRTRDLDLVRVRLEGCDPMVAVNAIVAGVGGRVSEEMDGELKAAWGPLSYLRRAVDVVGRLESFHADLSVDDEKVALDALNVVVANGRFAGHGVPIAPAADPFDGRLDLAVVREASLLELSRLAPSLLRGEDPGSPLFVTRRGSRVEVEADRDIPFSVDGEIYSARTARFEIAPAALRVRVDAEADAVS